MIQTVRTLLIAQRQNNSTANSPDLIEVQMTFHFAPAVRDQVSLLIALAGASGSGKTFSALRIAKGMAPSGKIAFIDTEARRGLHYAEQFDFLHTDMRPPFRPERFIEAIRAAESVG